jgi:tRNA(fMet)-specific endonuclease VapC
VARLILDTGVLINSIRGRLDLTAITDEDDVALPAVAVAEYLAGVLLDDDHSRRSVQRTFLNEVLAVVLVEDYDPAVAEHHAELLAYTRRAGRKRGAHDLIIAATARATNRILVTTDERAQFDELPDVQTHLLKIGKDA